MRRLAVAEASQLVAQLDLNATEPALPVWALSTPPSQAGFTVPFQARVPSVTSCSRRWRRRARRALASSWPCAPGHTSHAPSAHGVRASHIPSVGRQRVRTAAPRERSACCQSLGRMAVPGACRCRAGRS
eukprot:2497322-Rhodomonas_salina.2